MPSRGQSTLSLFREQENSQLNLDVFLFQQFDMSSFGMVKCTEKNISSVCISTAQKEKCSPLIMRFFVHPGRHVNAAEALQLGIVDQVTEHNTVDVAVKFALSLTGEAKKKKREQEE